MDGARLSPQLLLRPRGLGTFLGVFVPCTCTIFGVVVFLRLGFVVGQAGLYCALLLVLASYAICLLTTLSLCALIADGDDRHRRGSVSDTGSPAKDPGVYAALRQAVGTPLGGALGLAFYLAFTVDVAFYIIGFAEMFSRAADVSSSIQIFPWNPPGSWVDTAVASAALALLALVCACGVHVSARVSLLTLCVICACILASLACLLFPTDDALSGHTQFSLTTLANNSAPALEDFDGRGLSLMKMFTLTFPGFTGILAGSNLSANLRTPTRSIAAGTLASLLFVLVTCGDLLRARRRQAPGAQGPTRDDHGHCGGDDHRAAPRVRRRRVHHALLGALLPARRAAPRRRARRRGRRCRATATDRPPPPPSPCERSS